MKFKFSSYFFFLLVITTLTSCQSDENSDYVELPSLQERLLAGGDTTVFLTSSNSFSTPAANLNGNDLDMHLDGDFQFEAAFVTAPANVNGGIGPIFNNSSCISCHPKDGRAPFPDNINGLSGFFLRSSISGITENGGPVPVPNYGLQIQNQAIFGYEPEAKFQVNYTTIVETLADGTQVTLQKPNYDLIDTYVAVPSSILLSPRLAPPVFGLGLLEAISESEILMHQDINDIDDDGISGKANYVHDIISGTTQLGRFGWKANTATILEQCAGAYLGDMGITSYIFPQETGFGQTNGSDGFEDDPEITEEILNQVAFYCQTLAVPAPRDIEKESVRRGAQIFEDIQCASCHVPSMTTSSNSISAISNQTIYAYTDMLLHDMGDDLADNRPDFLANGNEWKTRPLWGIGLTQVVNGHTDFLHDGRAKNITEAILWHGGEALTSKDSFKELSTRDRRDLLDFINSL
ncbi:di-heme oxidoreductase family protein [Psychroserpens ponticola]|uniref:Di-heme oxidoredictase family protein n=1 Tax=Psychroserpens ponticola TaxID=2932268 RepID=A0ABY7RWJ5_9FLAO|nr:di-heme oxidoredictase family protein [Psychroserpens ponticola]WCO01368.1 di-heme oxidoredictase family protein [Psychroserpens ponticola]